MFGIPAGNVIVFLLFIIFLDYVYARKRQRRMEVLIRERNEARAAVSTDLQVLRDTTTLETLPLALGDAAICVVVIDRVPNAEDKINADRPVIWMHPRLQRSWRWLDRDEVWEENTVIGRNGINQLCAFMADDIFIHANVVWQNGARAGIRTVNEADNSTPDGQQRVQEAVAHMHPEICRGMDAQAGADVWTEIREAHERGETVTIDRDRPVSEGVVHRVARAGLDNPFEGRRRPVNIDEE